MSRAPRITGSELISALKAAGFEVIRVRGSHHFLRHADARMTVVPVHAGETLGAGLLNRILRDCHFNNEDLISFLRKQ